MTKNAPQGFNTGGRLAAMLLGAWLITALDASEQPAASLPYSPSLNLESLDTSADACEDFYQYACGGWIENNPIPADQARIDIYRKLAMDNQRYLWGILEELSREDSGRNPRQRLLGDYFSSCMDLDSIEKEGVSPLNAALREINQLQSKDGLGALIGSLIAKTDSTAFFIALGSQQDAKESEKMIGAIYAAGLGLPDRDYYFEDDERTKETRWRYVGHMTRMFQLLGRSEEIAKRSSTTVMRIERALAGATLTRVETRDPYNIYHRQSLDELQAMTPSVNWGELFDRTTLKPEPWLNVMQPAFMKEMEALIGRESLEDLKTYLSWGLVNTRAQHLSRAFRDENFAFYSGYLEGIDQPRPRWRTCVSMADHQLGEALGQEFVERNFPPEVRDDALRMSRQIRQVMAERIDVLEWMSPETREQAHQKLARIRDKIGYPDEWRDYSPIRIDRGDWFGNVTRATEFDLKRQLDHIGKPVDLDEWFMTPATVNAYYNPSMNDINFPAAVLMPPLFDPKMDDAPNYGNTGGTIGHELVHGFDDAGRKYDGEGNLRDWWTAKDAEAFEQRAQCIRDQYAGYNVIDDIYINSELTAGEDIADLGGLILAYHAWRMETKNQRLTSLDGLTPDQRFFIGFAQWACAAERPESLRLHAATDPHSPPRHRINGVVVNMPEFRDAFNCDAEAAMVKKKAEICRIW